MIKILVCFVCFLIGMTYLGELESERECALLGKEMNLPSKEYFGIPCLVQVNGHWIPARNLRENPSH